MNSSDRSKKKCPVVMAAQKTMSSDLDEARIGFIATGIKMSKV
jgi:hypothetical protein